MGRRNENNRLAHKKKVDAKKNRENEAKAALKAKKKAILNKFNLNPNESGTTNTPS
ncbi:hypothetical protein LXD69_17080 [Flavobacterium sediminilitoris]|uniref:Uncharacterized protein n=1 Tax=Flavobacterium sediminilitoris TaxID=2024526 RepID=A0ABY4HLK2_9FLAO|nr:MULTISPECIES: hypothetical protein [Flavobacterium]UOX33734.1 hypothetical protein LXD69_17080 [Flavobacterium sediminilitoris]